MDVVSLKWSESPYAESDSSKSLSYKLSQKTELYGILLHRLSCAKNCISSNEDACLKHSQVELEAVAVQDHVPPLQMAPQTLWASEPRDLFLDLQALRPLRLLVYRRELSMLLALLCLVM